MKKRLRPELGAALLFAMAIESFLTGIAYAMSLPATHSYVEHMARIAGITPKPGSFSQGMAWALTAGFM